MSLFAEAKVFDKPLEEITEIDLEKLIKEATPLSEVISQIFKAESPGSKGYSEEEFIANLAAESNRGQERYFFIGITKSKGHPPILSTCGILADSDLFDKLLEKASTSIVPPLEDLAIRVVPLASGMSVVVVRVGKSTRRPHWLSQKWGNQWGIGFPGLNRDELIKSAIETRGLGSTTSLVALCLKAIPDRAGADNKIFVLVEKRVDLIKDSIHLFFFPLFEVGNDNRVKSLKGRPDLKYHWKAEANPYLDRIEMPSRIEVRGPLRSRGLGSYLFSQIVDWAHKYYPQLKPEDLDLAANDAQTNEDRIRRNSFYKRHGYKLILDSEGIEGIATVNTALDLKSYINPDKIEELDTKALLGMLEEALEEKGEAEIKSNNLNQSITVIYNKYLDELRKNKYLRWFAIALGVVIALESYLLYGLLFEHRP